MSEWYEYKSNVRVIKFLSDRGSIVTIYGFEIGAQVDKNAGPPAVYLSTVRCTAMCQDPRQNSGRAEGPDLVCRTARRLPREKPALVPIQKHQPARLRPGEIAQHLPPSGCPGLHQHTVLVRREAVTYEAQNISVVIATAKSKDYKYFCTLQQ